MEVDHFSDVPEPYYSAIFQTAKKLSPAIQKATGCTRVTAMFLGFQVPHCHYQLIPMESESDLDHANAKKAESEDLKAMHEKILAELTIENEYTRTVR